MNRKPKLRFKKRYVLYKGYPLVSKDTGLFEGMSDINEDYVYSQAIFVNKILCNSTPKYRLVLERIK